MSDATLINGSGFTNAGTLALTGKQTFIDADKICRFQFEQLTFSNHFNDYQWLFLQAFFGLSQKYCDLMKIVLDNSQNFRIISHILRHDEPSGHALVIL